MWNLLWPVLVVVSANTVYNICAKSTPPGVNVFASLSMTYLVATICSATLFFATGDQKNLVFELSKTNWTTYVLGIAITLLEAGFLCVFRAGWKISTASLFCSIALGCVLLVVGLVFYKETLSIRQCIGLIVCATGLALIIK